MVLASGFVVFGGARVWRRLDLSGIVLMAIGGWIAVETRPYAGWFLISAGVLIVLHSSLRRLDRPLKAMPLIYAVIIAGFIAAPTLVQVSSHKSLEKLQQSQNANTNRGVSIQSTDQNGNNLALESVDYSTRGRVFANLPKRMRDILIPSISVAGLEPQSTARGGRIALCAGVLRAADPGCAATARTSAVPDRPDFYPALFLLVAYALSAGNAGTGFRYRTHIVLLAVAALFALREGIVPAAFAPQAAAPPARREPERSLAVVQ